MQGPWRQTPELNGSHASHIQAVCLQDATMGEGTGGGVLDPHQGGKEWRPCLQKTELPEVEMDTHIQTMTVG